MKHAIDIIGKELDFPIEAIETMQDAWRRLEEEGEAEVYRGIIDEYRLDLHMDLKDATKKASDAGAACGVHRYTAELLLFMLLTQPLHEHYEKAGISSQIWHDSCMDLHWKLQECQRVYGIWGSFVAWWFPGFFDLTRFALGRLQFELIDFPKEYAESGSEKPEGMTKVINVHIPSCGRLKREEYTESYRMAAAFFANAFPGDTVAFVCESWLLFGGHREMLPEDSGIIGFMNDYNCFHQGDTYEDLWRIFHREWDGDAASLPEDTSLQRAYKQWLLEGKKPGFGYGIRFFKKC